jgi:hypothetical protein
MLSADRLFPAGYLHRLGESVASFFPVIVVAALKDTLYMALHALGNGLTE